MKAIIMHAADIILLSSSETFVEMMHNTCTMHKAHVYQHTYTLGVNNNIILLLLYLYILCQVITISYTGKAVV